ncbi:MAG TPA: hypothetical protein DEH03_03965, partial [Brevundimonas sp.]|nr:hypothetical protein [Brevundimonas sp.]
MARPPSGKGPPKAATGDDDKRIWNRVTSTVTPPVRRKAARVTPGAVMPALGDEDAPLIAPPP